jgi:hypothetical protein
VIAACAATVVAHQPASDSSIVERFLQRPSELHTYEATRHLEAGALGRRGWADARTRYTPADGFTYEIIASGGTGFIVNRVLRPLLQREKEAIETGDASKSAVDRSNYDLVEGPPTGDGLARILLRPKRREDQCWSPFRARPPPAFTEHRGRRRTRPLPPPAWWPPVVGRA